MIGFGISAWWKNMREDPSGIACGMGWEEMALPV
jgi:hypothetical protein